MFLVSYRYNENWFRGNLDGTSPVSDSSILSNFTLAPTRMKTETHNFILQYAPTDDLTIQVLLPLVHRRMNFVNASGIGSNIDITDLSDIPVTFMYVLRRWNRQQIHLNMGVQFPVGVNNTLTQFDAGFPNANSPVLTYPMRTSDGTYDYLPGLTYLGQSDKWTWGAQSVGTLRVGMNAYGYRLGNQVGSTAWLSRRVTEYMGASFRVDDQIWGNIHGEDAGLSQTLTPTNVPGLQAGQRVNLLFGVNFQVPVIGPFTGRYQNYFSFESGLPVYQSLTGPQLREQFVLFANWNVIF